MLWSKIDGCGTNNVWTWTRSGNTEFAVNQFGTLCWYAGDTVISDCTIRVLN